MDTTLSAPSRPLNRAAHSTATLSEVSSAARPWLPIAVVVGAFLVPMFIAFSVGMTTVGQLDKSLTCAFALVGLVAASDIAMRQFFLGPRGLIMRLVFGCAWMLTAWTLAYVMGSHMR